MATLLKKQPIKNRGEIIAPITTADAVIYKNQEADPNIKNSQEALDILFKKEDKLDERVTKLEEGGGGDSHGWVNEKEVDGLFVKIEP